MLRCVLRFAPVLAALLVSPFASAQRVDALWETNCMSCHGRDGSGVGGVPSLVAGRAEEGSERRQLDALRGGLDLEGHDFRGSLNDSQMWALVAHLREKQARAWRNENGSPEAGSDGVFTSDRHSFRVETVIDGGLSTPWSVDFVPGGPMLVTSRSGELHSFRNGRLTTIRDTPRVRHRGQGGLMDVAVHPDYEENGWIYLAFADKLEASDRSEGMTKIVRGAIRRGAWVNEETVFEADRDDYVRSDLHFGCRIVFEASERPGPDGATHLVYFAIGERGLMDHAQDLARPNGKIHRLWDNGEVPADNPFVERSRSEAGVYGSIWSFGHRNPQGLAMDSEGRLWDTEHGPRGGDELNLIEPERNYGWPIVSYGINYSGDPFRTPFPDSAVTDEAIAMPTAVWLPSIAACGLDAVRLGAGGEGFSDWEGDLLAGGLAGSLVERIRVSRAADHVSGYRAVEREELIHGQGRVRDVVCGPDGSIYVVLNGPDRVIRLVAAD